MLISYLKPKCFVAWAILIALFFTSSTSASLEHHEKHRFSNILLCEYLKEMLDSAREAMSRMPLPRGSEKPNEKDHFGEVPSLKREEFSSEEKKKVLDFLPEVIDTISSSCTEQKAYEAYRQLFAFELGEKKDKLFYTQDGKMAVGKEYVEKHPLHIENYVKAYKKAKDKKKDQEKKEIIDEFNLYLEACFHLLMQHMVAIKAMSGKELKKMKTDKTVLASSIEAIIPETSVRSSFIWIYEGFLLHICDREKVIKMQYKILKKLISDNKWGLYTIAVLQGKEKIRATIDLLIKLNEQGVLNKEELKKIKKEVLKDPEKILETLVQAEMKEASLCNEILEYNAKVLFKEYIESLFLIGPTLGRCINAFTYKVY